MTLARNLKARLSARLDFRTMTTDLKTRDSAPEKALRLKFSGYQMFVVALLAFLQFSIVLDFMIISPLGAIIMPDLNISPQRFGEIVSAFAFSAGVSGFLAAGFADRFDRKRFLLFFYSGFIAGTALCALAPNYPLLLVARIVTGLFGGVIASVVLAIATDLFPLRMRGRVMGIVQTAFSASQVLGFPTGLYIANLWNWHAAFPMIVLIAIPVGLIIAIYMRPVVGHLALKQNESPWRHLTGTVLVPRYAMAFATTALLVTGGYMLLPFASAYTVGNLGIPLTDLPTVYLVSGMFTIFAGPLIGRISDGFGKFQTFIFGCALSIVMVLNSLYAPSPCDAGHRDRRQRLDVRWYIFTHDPVASADISDTRGWETGLLQRGQRLSAATLRRHRLNHRRHHRCARSRWRHQGLR